MTPFNLQSHEIELSLGALKQLALTDGDFAEQEYAFLDAAKDFMGFDGSIDDIKPVGPEALVPAIQNPKKRLRVLQSLMIMALMDTKVDAKELEFIDACSKALNVKESRRFILTLLSRNFREVARWILPFTGKMFNPKVKESWDRGGFWAIFNMFTFPFGGKQDPILYAKYEQLADYPADTLGRVYFEHMQAKGFSLPGGKKAFPEIFVPHDLSHILAGFDTDATGEVEAVAFISGYMKSDPFWYLLMIVAHMHLGMEVFVGDPVGHGAADPHRMLDALKRGMMVNHDLYDAWDFWPDFALPLEQVRRKYNVVPSQRLVS